MILIWWIKRTGEEKEEEGSLEEKTGTLEQGHGSAQAKTTFLARAHKVRPRGPLDSGSSCVPLRFHPWRSRQVLTASIFRSANTLQALPAQTQSL